MSNKENLRRYIKTTKLLFYGSLILLFAPISLAVPNKITSPEILIILPDVYCFYVHVGFNNTGGNTGAETLYSSHNQVLSNNKTKFEGKFNIDIKKPGYYNISSFNFSEKVYFYSGKNINTLLTLLIVVGGFGTVVFFITTFILSWIEINLK
ncbi:hypothetical protein [Leptospira meyeri]|uniref:hypothetical protein n=1 Tax=Leptospira meyeri TaxID=29508 RepID=UPI0002BE8ACA|nr:hypothetical protein [Leptospira meyeri]EMJ85566.1 hypothetical protein LEP1GSC196_0437 [Leptospira meyeri serovar Semaranga str. Veldrot Semarang 173]